MRWFLLLGLVFAALFTPVFAVAQSSGGSFGGGSFETRSSGGGDDYGGASAPSYDRDRTGPRQLASDRDPYPESGEWLDRWGEWICWGSLGGFMGIAMLYEVVSTILRRRRGQ